jgi:hypothetical protein
MHRWPLKKILAVGIIVTALLVAVGLILFGNGNPQKQSNETARRSPVRQKTATVDIDKDRLSRLRKIARMNPALPDAVDDVDAVVAALDKTEILAAIEYLKNSSTGDESEAELQELMIRRWAEIDPAAATAWVMAMPAGAARDSALVNVAIVRANTDLSEAIAWVKSLNEGEERDRVQLAIANEAVRTQPEETLRLVSELPESAANDELIRRAAMEWTSNNQAEALAWARNIEDDELRSRVCAGVAIAWAETDPAAAGTFAANDLPPGRLQNDVVVAIVQRWGQHEPEEAAAWVANFPAGELRQAAIENLASIWGQTDPFRSRQWVEEITTRKEIR